MNPTLTARVETFDLGNGLHLSEANRLRVLNIAGLINKSGVTSLDRITRWLHMEFASIGDDCPNWHVHQGGHHVALSFLVNGNATRVLIVTEERPTGHADAQLRQTAIAYREQPQTAAVAPNAALQAMIDGTYDQKPGDEPAAREAAEARTRVMGYVATLRREERLYAAAYAHWLDEVGADGAVERLQQEGRTYGLDARTRQFLRVAVNTAKGGR